MEDDLDRIAAGEEESVPWLTHFYFGDDGLKHKVASRLDEIDPRAIGSIPIGVNEDGTDVVARIGRYGPYVEIGEERASIPEDLAPDELTVEKATELVLTPERRRQDLRDRPRVRAHCLRQDRPFRAIHPTR